VEDREGSIEGVGLVEVMGTAIARVCNFLIGILKNK
jgi:hypothetical protein